MKTLKPDDKLPVYYIGEVFYMTLIELLTWAFENKVEINWTEFKQKPEDIYKGLW